MDILKQLNDAVAYIEENLDREIDLGRAAQIACVTEDSFIRFFSYMTGITLKEYIRRRRLTLAAYELRGGNARVIDVAVKYGYGSADGFTKAFAKQHGVTPTDVREEGCPMKVCPPASFYIMVKGAQNMDFRMIEVPEMQVYGVSREISGDGPQRYEERGMMWSEDGDFVPGQICRGFDGLWYGIWQDGKYWIAREKENTQKEYLEEHRIPAGTYAAFQTERGGFAGDVLPKLHDLIFHSWLPDSGYEQAADYEIEVYHLWTDRAERRKKRYYEIWIPVKKKN